MQLFQCTLNPITKTTIKTLIIWVVVAVVAVVALSALRTYPPAPPLTPGLYLATTLQSLPAYADTEANTPGSCVEPSSSSLCHNLFSGLTAAYPSMQPAKRPLTSILCDLSAPVFQLLHSAARLLLCAQQVVLHQPDA
jgi:hypothetical protein